MIPVVYFQSDEPGTCEGMAAFASPRVGFVGGTMGPILVQVFPLSVLRSTQTAQER